MPDKGRDFECGNHGIQYEYDDFILKSLRDDGVHVKLPIEDDYDIEQGRFSLLKARNCGVCGSGTGWRRGMVPP
jgi:hypothetical protein